MNESDQGENGNTQFPKHWGGLDSATNLVVSSNPISQSQNRNENEDDQERPTNSQELAVSVQNNSDIIDKRQISDLSSYLISQNKSNMDSNEAISNGGTKNVNTNSDYLKANDGLNTMDSASIVQSIGHILSKARTAKGMSVEDVSRQLRLSVQQIEAIEKENFDKLPGRTFLRGFIRNYANLLQLDPTPLLQSLPGSVAAMSTHEGTPLRNKQISFSSNRENPGNSRLAIIIVLFAIALGAYYFFENNDWNKKNQDNLTSNKVKINPEKTSVEIELPLSAAVRNTTSGANNKIPEAIPAMPGKKQLEENLEVKTETLAIPIENKPTQEPEKPATPAGSKLGHLNFKFSADSWIKVTDGKGSAIFEQLKKGGSEQIISGQRPFSIVIGNASGVNLTYNDTTVNVSSYKKKDGTARFTLE